MWSGGLEEGQPTKTVTCQLSSRIVCLTTNMRFSSQATPSVDAPLELLARRRSLSVATLKLIGSCLLVWFGPGLRIVREMMTIVR